MAGMVIDSSAPDIIKSPSALLTTITAIAPAFCAAFTFTTNVQLPLLKMTIFPLIAAALEGATHPWEVPPVLSK